jgi:hypothetical protein
MYYVVYYDGAWRIRFENLHLGHFATAETASEAALKVAQSRFEPNPRVQVTNGPDGEITIGDPEESA